MTPPIDSLSNARAGRASRHSGNCSIGTTTNSSGYTTSAISGATASRVPSSPGPARSSSLAATSAKASPGCGVPVTSPVTCARPCRIVNSSSPSPSGYACSFVSTTSFSASCPASPDIRLVIGAQNGPTSAPNLDPPGVHMIRDSTFTMRVFRRTGAACGAEASASEPEWRCAGHG